ncbi:MAG: DUF1841 family protein [Gammaproteobacteria bacterium]|nr:DUF1841 family protein [Gammaproteobacteria bacterium]MCF6363316.1 DUF1841 family protein [Gammaproteobacteria bacterium]
MFGQSREQLRRMYVDAWRKQQTDEPLSPLETMIAEVVTMHPEYQALLKRGEDALDKDFPAAQGETNPFMHMGMHIAIREQLSTDRPAGIVDAIRTLLARVQDAHEVEHRVMECLGQSLWEAQRAGQTPDEVAYLRCVQGLARH